MTTNPALRDVLAAFRSMVRARGPRECLEVACLWNLSSECAADNEAWDLLVNGRLAARAALRWWRWAERTNNVQRIAGPESAGEITLRVDARNGPPPMARDVAEMLTNTAKAIAATDRCLRDVKRSPLRCAVKELIANRNGFVFTLQVGMPTSA